MTFKYKILSALSILIIGAILIVSFSPDAGTGYNPVVLSSAVLNFPSTNPGESSDLTISTTGATDANPVIVGVPNSAIASNSFYMGWVSSSGTVTVRFINISVLPIDPPSATFRVAVLRF